MAEAITEMLHAWRAGDAGAHAALGAEVYAALKQIARQRLRGSGPATLDATGLVHEAVARMLDSEADWRSRAHFYALAALQMRSVLVDGARRRHAAKRGGEWAAITLDTGVAAVADDASLLELHEALEQLAAEDGRTARVIELTYFGGLSAAQVAEVCAISVATVERDLKFGRAWLREALGR